MIKGGRQEFPLRKGLTPEKLRIETTTERAYLSAIRDIIRVPYFCDNF